MPEAIKPVWNLFLRQNSGTVGTFKFSPRSTISSTINLFGFITQRSVNVSVSLTAQAPASLRMAFENLEPSVREAM
jgi:hypothetical protein